MELYFKDFEDESNDSMSAGSDCNCGALTASEETAEEDAFAEILPLNAPDEAPQMSPEMAAAARELGMEDIETLSDTAEAAVVEDEASVEEVKEAGD